MELGSLAFEMIHAGVMANMIFFNEGLFVIYLRTTSFFFED